ncbi:unnamed protein product [Clonostachys rosea]|uniref:ZZ-type domain-containing protein n=1 Tax=Bionectria ochroleuca TaxID=29856 RepID=A0ABY6TQ54_BIOOC|nr:unnamed protein product [Clonostachys rosea]
MASSATSLDTMITVKVHYDGITRRAKMPLRDTAPKSLEDRTLLCDLGYYGLATCVGLVMAVSLLKSTQIRVFLHVPAEQKIMIERYSDSAASFVTLDPTNASVYKQLYRAAKAKSKLKLRVTRLVDESSVEPKPVTIEDSPEESSSPSVETETSAPVALDSNFLSSQETLTAARVPAPKPVEETQETQQVWKTCLPEITPIECAKFAICCNSCDKTTPDVHYHCSTCEDGDFDLCQSCVDMGITCHGSDHWLIKRTTKDGQIITSTTETIAPKPKEKPFDEASWPTIEAKLALARLEHTMSRLNVSMRTCNSCVAEHPEAEFLHCKACDDFDLCRACFSGDAHGHHPGHAFQLAVADTPMPEHITAKLSPGRNQPHYALCDGCDKFITGIRHKCLECPDWDYCAECMPSAPQNHPKHRFVSVYEPLQLPIAAETFEQQAIHTGVYCDGPVCARTSACTSHYIRGIRYKCAVCHDVDLCETCEASPENKHNKTHPMIKFKTPVRHVSVTTTGEHSDGHAMPAMGDRLPPVSTPSINAVRTVVDMKPEEKAAPEASEPRDLLEFAAEEKAEVKEETEEENHAPSQHDLRAVFVRDTVADGTILPPDHIFEQTWVLRNEGQVSWPAGCSVKFVSGDYMGRVNSSHPAVVSDLVSAAETTICSEPLAPGEEHSFSVLLRTPTRAGKSVSYWRLTTPDGYRFGHHVWCAVNVRNTEPAPVPVEETPEVKVEESPEPTVEEKAEEEETPEVNSSQMIFPKLEKESPVASIHEEVKPHPAESKPSAGMDADEDEWDLSDDNFITDDEYDILDASDEEFLQEQQNKLLKK